MVHDKGPAAVVKKLHEWAIANKRTPESLHSGEPLHVDFLYSMFTRDSPNELVQRAKASGSEMEWKKIIAENAALFSDSIGRMNCEPFKFDLKDPTVTSKRKSWAEAERHQRLQAYCIGRMNLHILLLRSRR